MTYWRQRKINIFPVAYFSVSVCHFVSREAEPVEDESPPSEEEDDYQVEMEEEETPMESEDGESPSVTEESLGSFEGSSEGADLATAAEIDIGSGDFATETAELKGILVTKDGFSFNN